MKIVDQRTNALDAKERLELASLLVKAGYRVMIGGEKNPANGKTRAYIEALEPGE